MAHRHGVETPHGHDTDQLMHSPRLYDFAMRLWGHGGRRWRASVVDRLNPAPGQRVLDVASGTGQLALLLARRVVPGGAVDGVDASEAMVDHANRAAQRSGDPVRFSLARAQALPFDDETFDGVTCTLAMHHVALADRPTAVAEIFRVLRPGGRLVLADAQRPARRPTLWVRFVFSHAIAERPLDQATELMRDAGFTEVTRFDTSVPFIGLAVGTKPAATGNVGRDRLS